MPIVFCSLQISKWEYSWIPVEDAIAMIQRLVFEFQNVIHSKCSFYLLIKSAARNCPKKHPFKFWAWIFTANFWHGTNLAPILANIYMAIIENKSHKKCVLDPNINDLFYLKDSLKMVFASSNALKMKWNSGSTNLICWGKH